VKDRYRVGIVGATGMAGSTVLRVLQDRNFPVGDLVAMASSRSAGAEIEAFGRRLRVVEVTDTAMEGCDLVLFAAGADVARRYTTAVTQGGGIAVDKSSAFRMDTRIPLVVPEVNGEAAVGARVISNPNCVAIPLTVALAPLHRLFGLTAITVATYQSASGGGRALVEELEEQRRAVADRRPPLRERYPHVLEGNVVPGGWSMHGADSDEEVKVAEETRRVMGLPGLRIRATTVRVPVAIGHSMAVWCDFESKLELEGARAALAAAPGIRLVDQPADQRYPTPLQAQGTDDVWVGRLRQERGDPHSLGLFISCDNLRKGAATNAVQVAEISLGLQPVPALGTA
jgi:aspartate-semialdehyde dehydrogenase